MRILFLVSTIFLLSGCTKDNYNNYSYLDEEQSKYSVQESELKEDDSVQKSLQGSESIMFSTEVVAIDQELCNDSNFLIYGYKKLLDKAEVIMTTSNYNYFSDFTLHVDLFDDNKNLVDSVDTFSINFIGGSPVVLYFPVQEDIAYIQVISASFNAKELIDVSNSGIFESKIFDSVHWKRKSNTTFSYQANTTYFISLLDENGVQIDSAFLQKGKHELVTVQGVVYYKLARIKED